MSSTRRIPVAAVVALALVALAFTPWLLQGRGGGLRGSNAGLGSVRGSTVRGSSGRTTSVRGISERGRSDRADGGRYGSLRDRRGLLWIDDDDETQNQAQSELDAARAAADTPPPSVYSGSLQPGAVADSLDDATKVNYDRRTYYVADGIWYLGALKQGKKVYTVTTPPEGALLRSLPDGVETTRSGDKTYARYKGIVYEEVNRLGKTQYQVSRGR